MYSQLSSLFNLNKLTLGIKAFLFWIETKISGTWLKKICLLDMRGCTEPQVISISASVIYAQCPFVGCSKFILKAVNLSFMHRFSWKPVLQFYCCNVYSFSNFHVKGFMLSLQQLLLSQHCPWFSSGAFSFLPDIYCLLLLHSKSE